MDLYFDPKMTKAIMDLGQKAYDAGSKDGVDKALARIIPKAEQAEIVARMPGYGGKFTNIVGAMLYDWAGSAPGELAELLESFLQTEGDISVWYNRAPKAEK